MISPPWVAAAVLLLLLVLVQLARTVRGDGLGHRPPPARSAEGEGQGC
ncbi:hypothetical protein [Cellulomonas phragmiteti]|nr:hypothetical protein [Cellulomonas phragmiteti]